MVKRKIISAQNPHARMSICRNPNIPNKYNNYDKEKTVQLRLYYTYELLVCSPTMSICI